MVVVPSSPSMVLPARKRASFARDTGRPAWWTSSTEGAPTTVAASSQTMVSLQKKRAEYCAEHKESGM
ncbi:unnamed protein product, partial [Ectocarpus sp. 13 AM-2016]